MGGKVVIVGGTGGIGAALAAFLLGPESSWITGQILALDGGRSSIEAEG
jgi:NAD(P)-dependent dehydrogenase (short-subunit alcohol dehydrogenase family)